MNALYFRKVRTLYACRGENEMELSFEPNEVIHNGMFVFFLTFMVLQLYYFQGVL